MESNFVNPAEIFPNPYVFGLKKVPKERSNFKSVKSKTLPPKMFHWRRRLKFCKHWRTFLPKIGEFFGYSPKVAKFLWFFQKQTTFPRKIWRKRWRHIDDPPEKYQLLFEIDINCIFSQIHNFLQNNPLDTQKLDSQHCRKTSIEIPNFFAHVPKLFSSGQLE